MFASPCVFSRFNTHSDHALQLWIWKNDDIDTLLYFDHHETVRFRVDSEEWHDQTPVGPDERDNGVIQKSPYRIIASMDGDGLGPLIWWEVEPDQGQDED